MRTSLPPWAALEFDLLLVRALLLSGVLLHLDDCAGTRSDHCIDAHARASSGRSTLPNQGVGRSSSHTNASTGFRR